MPHPAATIQAWRVVGVITLSTAAMYFAIFRTNQDATSSGTSPSSSIGGRVAVDVTEIVYCLSLGTSLSRARMALAKAALSAEAKGSGPFKRMAYRKCVSTSLSSGSATRRKCKGGYELCSLPVKGRAAAVSASSRAEATPGGIHAYTRPDVLRESICHRARR